MDNNFSKQALKRTKVVYVVFFYREVKDNRNKGDNIFSRQVLKRTKVVYVVFVVFLIIKKVASTKDTTGINNKKEG